MEMNSLSNRISNLSYNYSSTGSLDGNSRAEKVTSDDYLTLAGLSFCTELFIESDNKEGVDLDPRPNHVRLTPESLAKGDGGTAKASVPGEEITGEFRIKETPKGKTTIAQAESLDAKEHVAWRLFMTPDTATIVALEDLGDTFKATAIEFNDKEGSKQVRTGLWTELPDSVSFGG